jgi:hypothetical protein
MVMVGSKERVLWTTRMDGAALAFKRLSPDLRHPMLCAARPDIAFVVSTLS